MSVALAVVAAVLLLPILVAAAGAGLRSPIGVLVTAYALIVPFGSAIDLPIPLPPPFDTLSSLAGVAAIGGMLMHLVLARKGAPRLVPALAAWAGFLGLCAASYAWSIDRDGTWTDLLLLASVVVLYGLTTLMPVSEPQVARIRDAIILGGALASLLGVFQLATGRTPVGESGQARFLLTGGDPNHTAAGLLLPLLLAVGRATHRGERPRTRVVSGGAAALMGIGILLTGSRGGLVALAAGLGVVFLQDLDVRRVLVAGGVLSVGLVFGLALAPADLETRLTTAGSTGRTDIWRLGVAACDRYCLAGSGWGTFPAVYQEEFRTNPAAGGYRTEGYRAHNIWLQAVVEVGVAGLVLLVVAYGASVVDALRLPRDERGPPLAALVAMAVASSLVSNLTFKYFWLVPMYAALAASARRGGPSLRPGAVTLEATPMATR